MPTEQSDRAEETMTQLPPPLLSSLEYHVLLALGDGPRYGYAIKQAVASESSGHLTPRAGSLYRVLARLMTRGFVEESEPDTESAPHPGLERKYYSLSPAGVRAVRLEAQRLKSAADLAERRLGLADHPDA